MDKVAYEGTPEQLVQRFKEKYSRDYLIDLNKGKIKLSRPYFWSHMDATISFEGKSAVIEYASKINWVTFLIFNFVACVLGITWTNTKKKANELEMRENILAVLGVAQPLEAGKS